MRVPGRGWVYTHDTIEIISKNSKMDTGINYRSDKRQKSVRAAIVGANGTSYETLRILKSGGYKF